DESHGGVRPVSHLVSSWLQIIEADYVSVVEPADVLKHAQANVVTDPPHRAVGEYGVEGARVRRAETEQQRRVSRRRIRFVQQRLKATRTIKRGADKSGNVTTAIDVGFRPAVRVVPCGGEETLADQQRVRGSVGNALKR